MNLHPLSQRLAIVAALMLIPFSAPAQPELPAIHTLRDLMKAREAALTGSIAATYSIRVKRLPGKNVWWNTYVAPGNFPPKDKQLEDNATEYAGDCRLDLHGVEVKLAIVDPATPGHEEDYHTDGRTSWLYVPEAKGATLRAKPIIPRVFGEEKPWLPAWLTLFPTNVVSECVTGPMLSELLTPAAGHHVHVSAAGDDDILLEVRTPVAGNHAGIHDCVCQITLRRSLGFAPVHYVTYVQVGAEDFPPDVEANYDQFIQSGSLQIPTHIAILTSRDERVHGKVGDPLHPTDFQHFDIEECTVTVDKLEVAPTFDPDLFAFRLPVGTHVYDESSGLRYTTKAKP